MMMRKDLPAFGNTSSPRVPAATLGQPSTKQVADLHRQEAAERGTLHVLIVDEDPAIRQACAEIAQSMGFSVETAVSVAAARERLKAGPVDLMLLDIRLPGGGGVAFLEEVHVKYPRTVVVATTASATVDSAVEVMRIGASDHLTKPFSLEELTSALERAAERRTFDVESRALRASMRTGKSTTMLVGQSPAMEKLYRILSKVALTAHPVLILGESGTGKELIARAIHANGPNAANPFIPVDCGSLVPTLIESELFGHVKGAFTGANRAKPGLLVAADHGTVFLDEIGELPLDLQARLLRALQEKEVRPVGATHSLPISARIVAATNRDLAAMVESGRFRKDLYFRLNVVNIRVPALRERKSDIPLLAAHVLERLRRENNVAYTFSDETLRLLMDYDWPGNVRELEHAIERACALSSGPVLHIGDFTTQMQDHRLHMNAREHADEGGTGPNHGQPRVMSISEMEKQAILNTIRQFKGDKLMAAKLLGIGKTTLYRKLKEYGLGSDETLS